MDFKEKRVLGKTGLMVGRLGISSGYGIPAAGCEEAFEKGCNYFYWGTRRTEEMAKAIRNLMGKGKRDEMVLVVQVYNRVASMMAGSVERALKRVKLGHADVLLLGWYNSEPAPRILDAARALKERGLVRFIAMSGHHRPAFPEVAAKGLVDIIHLRYNAAHRGAESEVLPKLKADSRPGTVAYTATRWGNLLKPKRMPPGEKPPRAADCYRFCLSHPDVDVCMTGTKDIAQTREALSALELGPLSADEMARMIRIGDHVHKRGMF